MEFKRDSVQVAQVAIGRAIQYLIVCTFSVSLIIVRYRDTGGIALQQGSKRRRYVTTPKNVSINKEAKISRERMQYIRVLKLRSRLKPLEFQKVENLISCQLANLAFYNDNLAVLPKMFLEIGWPPQLESRPW